MIGVHLDKGDMGRHVDLPSILSGLAATRSAPQTRARPRLSSGLRMCLTWVSSRPWLPSASRLATGVSGFCRAGRTMRPLIPEPFAPDSREAASPTLELVSKAPTLYRIEACVVRPGVSAATSKGTVIEFDTSAGQSDVLPGPADLLTMAFAACVLKNVERFSQLLAFRYQQASITVTSERQDSPPKMIRVTYSLRLITDEPDHRVDLMHRNIRQHGTIYNTLAAACEVSGKVVSERPSPRIGEGAAPGNFRTPPACRGG
jgi:uncharacterized OsmC-like protein